MARRLPKLPDLRRLPGFGALEKIVDRLPDLPAVPAPLARARVNAATRARRAAVKTLTTASKVPVARPVAQLGMRILFDGLAGRWEAIRADPQYREGFRATLSSLPRGFRPRRVLDSACGSGLAAGVLLERWPGVHVIGTDVAPKMVAEAAAQVPEAHFQVASVFDLPFADGEFDLVTSLDGVIDLAEMLRVLHRKGRLLIVYSREAQTPVSRDLDALAGDAFTLGAIADVRREGTSHALIVRHGR